MGTYMNGTDWPSDATNQRFIDIELSDLSVEEICRKCSEDQQPPEAFLVASISTANQLLGVSLPFLEQGQSLPCPGLPLVGAAFDPTWGFAEATVGKCEGRLADFRAPISRFDMGEHGDTYGYRLCPIDVEQIPVAIGQLARIRAEMDKMNRRPKQMSVAKVAISRL